MWEVALRVARRARLGPCAAGQCWQAPAPDARSRRPNRCAPPRPSPLPAACASGSWDCTIRVWDRASLGCTQLVQTGASRRRRRHGGTARHSAPPCAMTPLGQKMLRGWRGGGHAVLVCAHMRRAPAGPPTCVAWPRAPPPRRPALAACRRLGGRPVAACWHAGSSLRQGGAPFQVRFRARGRSARCQRRRLSGANAALPARSGGARPRSCCELGRRLSGLCHGMHPTRCHAGWQPAPCSASEPWPAPQQGPAAPPAAAAQPEQPTPQQ